MAMAPDTGGWSTGPNCTTGCVQSNHTTRPTTSGRRSYQYGIRLASPRLRSALLLSPIALLLAPPRRALPARQSVVDSHLLMEVELTELAGRIPAV